MSAVRIAAVVLVALAAGIAAGSSLSSRPAEAAKPEMTPIEAPVQTTKQARLDRCVRQAWPYISSECLERVADAPRARAVEPTVTVALNDPATRTTQLVRLQVMKTASR